MKKTVGALAGVAMLLTGVGVAGATELAGPIAEPAMTMTVAPGEGFAGTTFEVSGEDCIGDVELEVWEEYVENSYRVVVPEVDGSWSTEFTVFDDVDVHTVIWVDADCVGNSEDVSSYESAFFEVIPDTALDLSPESGPAKSSFEVSGTDCVLEDAEESVTVTAGDLEQTVAPGEAGDWTATFMVPDDAAIGSTIDVEAVCTFSNFQMMRSIRQLPAGGNVQTFDYDAAVFTVTGETTTTQGTTTTTAAGAVEATAATATTATPTFTG
ncbi:hypothetical protein [Actinospongicola halichondriae]|uniref:hypothetical protein n=1 Tax=Actinospongicola halichondriae TaxID=3236844 RepID=UPI003D4BD368